MQDKLTPRQVRAWSLCALSVPAAMALPGCGWLWVLGGSILACALAACQQAMQRHSGLCMRQAFARAFGAVGGQIIAAAELLWLLFAASGAAAASQIAFEDDLGPFLPAIPLLLAALAGQKGRLAAGRVCAVLALCLAGLYAVIAAASLRHVQADWSRPQGVPADAALAFCLCLGQACMAFVTAEDVSGTPAKQVFLFPATKYAEENFRVVCTNIVMMGYIVAHNPDISLENAQNAIRAVMNPKVVDLNLKALQFGYEHGKADLA